ncbi:hypothetical protein QX249_10995 [Vibrio parahaemolyticus]|uniref:MarR family transcriptional regulator n=2 Tax=Vibrio parahaemolyticus TaxID=670 RepID=A0AAW8Q0S4_VIBPH|nr:hypothetical protein [Vibrio parahaemolyticus]
MMGCNKALTLYELATGDSVSSVIATMLKEQGLIESIESDKNGRYKAKLTPKGDKVIRMSLERS